jgi:hypothetical protein
MAKMAPFFLVTGMARRRRSRTMLSDGEGPAREGGWDEGC